MKNIKFDPLFELMYLETDYRPLLQSKLTEDQKKIIDIFMGERNKNVDIIITQHNPYSKEQKLVKLSDYFKEIKK